MSVFTAQQARKNVAESHSLTGEYLKEETAQILESIKCASVIGIETLSFTRTDSVIVQRLKSLGFSVEVIRDQRDGDCLNVTW